jgi:hypothetical protein
MSEEEDIFNLFHRCRKNDEWKAFLELMMDKNTTITTIPNVIVTNPIQKEPIIRSEHGLAPEALLGVRRAAGAAMAAKVQSGIKEIIKTIGKRRISGSASIANHDGISPTTSLASHMAIFQRVTLPPQ